MKITVMDALAVLTLARQWRQRADSLVDLYEKMRLEGRDTLTADELAELQSEDDAARNRLQAAIEAAGQVT